MFTVSNFNIKKPAFLTETLPQLKDQLKSTFSQPILASLHSIKRRTQQFQDEQQSIFLQVGSKVWEGVPRNMRTELWLSVLQRKDAALGSDASEKYEEMLSMELKPKTATDIDKDVPRTFPNTKKFHSLEGQTALRRVLRAYAAYDPEVGYCQGMNFLAGLLLLYLSEEHAFGALVLIMFERGFRLLYQCNMSLLQVQLWQLSQLMPSKLRTHMESCGVVPVLFAAPWLMTCYSADFPISFSSRVLDTVFSNNMVSPLLRVAVVLLKYCEKKLRTLPDMEDILMFLKLEVPAWEEMELHTILTEAFSKDWPERHKAVLDNTDGMETIAQAMARVHVTPDERTDEAQAIGTTVSASATTDSETTTAEANNAATDGGTLHPVLHVRVPSGASAVSQAGHAHGRSVIETEADGDAATPGSAASSCSSFLDVECMSQSGYSHEQDEPSPSAVHSPHSDFWDPYLHDLRLFTMGEIIELRNLSFNKTPRHTDHSGRGFGKGLVRSRSATAHCSLDGTGASSDEEEDDAAFFEVASRSGSISSVRSFHHNRSQSVMVEVGFPMSPSSTTSSSRVRFSKGRTGERSNLRAAANSSQSEELTGMALGGYGGALECIHGSLIVGDEFNGCSPRSVDSAPAAPFQGAGPSLLSKPSFICMSENEVMHSRAFPSVASLAMCMAAGSAVAEAIALNRAANASVTSSMTESETSMFTGRDASMMSALSQESSQAQYTSSEPVQHSLMTVRPDDTAEQPASQLEFTIDHPPSPGSGAGSVSALTASLSTALSASPTPGDVSPTSMGRHGSLHIALSRAESGASEQAVIDAATSFQAHLASMPSRLSRVNEWTEASLPDLTGMAGHLADDAAMDPANLASLLQPVSTGAAQHADMMYDAAGSTQQLSHDQDSSACGEGAEREESLTEEYTREPMQAALRAAHGSHLFPEVSRPMAIPAAPAHPSCSPSACSQASNIASSQLDGKIVDMDGWLQHFPANSNAVVDTAVLSQPSTQEDDPLGMHFATAGIAPLPNEPAEMHHMIADPPESYPAPADTSNMLPPGLHSSTAGVPVSSPVPEPSKPVAPVTDFSDIDVGLPPPTAPIPLRAMNAVGNGSSVASSPSSTADKQVTSLSNGQTAAEDVGPSALTDHAWQGRQLVHSGSQAQRSCGASSGALCEPMTAPKPIPSLSTSAAAINTFSCSPATPPITPSRLSQSHIPMSASPLQPCASSGVADVCTASHEYEAAFTPGGSTAPALSRQLSPSLTPSRRTSMTAIGMLSSNTPDRPCFGIPSTDPWLGSPSASNVLRSSITRRDPYMLSQSEGTPCHSAALSKNNSRLGSVLPHSPSHRLSSSAIWDANALDSQLSVGLGPTEDEMDGFARLASERLSNLYAQGPSTLDPHMHSHGVSGIPHAQYSSVISSPAAPCSPRHSISCIPDIPSITAMAQATFSPTASTLTSSTCDAQSPRVPIHRSSSTSKAASVADAAASTSPTSPALLRQHLLGTAQLSTQVTRQNSRRTSMSSQPSVDASPSAAFQSLVTAALLCASDAPAPPSPRTSNSISAYTPQPVTSSATSPAVSATISPTPTTAPQQDACPNPATTQPVATDSVALWDSTTSPPQSLVSSPAPLEHLNTECCISNALVTSHALQGSIHSTISSKHDSTPSSATKSIATPFMSDHCGVDDSSPLALKPAGTGTHQQPVFADPMDAPLNCKTPDVFEDALHGPLSDTTLSPEASPSHSPSHNPPASDNLPLAYSSQPKPWNHVLHVSVSTSPIQDTIFSMSPGHVSDSPDPATSASMDLLNSLPSVPYIQPSDGISDATPPPQGLWYNTGPPAALDAPGSPNIASSFQSVDSFILVSPPAYASMRSASGRPPSPGRDRLVTRGAAMFAALHSNHRPKKSLDSQILDQLNGFQANCAPAGQAAGSSAGTSCSQAPGSGQWQLQQSSSFSKSDKVDALNERLSAYLSDVTEVL